jgi:hypothetical protein
VLIPLIKRQGITVIFHGKYVILTMSVYLLVIAREDALVENRASVPVPEGL